MGFFAVLESQSPGILFHQHSLTSSSRKTHLWVFLTFESWKIISSTFGTRFRGFHDLHRSFDLWLKQVLKLVEFYIPSSGLMISKILMGNKVYSLWWSTQHDLWALPFSNTWHISSKVDDESLPRIKIIEILAFCRTLEFKSWLIACNS